jgi:hypothetical protein
MPDVMENLQQMADEYSGEVVSLVVQTRALLWSSTDEKKESY